MNSETVLIVDDAPANLKLTRLVLSGAGYDVCTAADAEEALQLVKDFRPRAVLTDIRLQGMDGLELVRRLRTDPATHDMVILAVTASALRSDEQKAAEAGCDGFIVKPYDTRKLPAILRQHLSRPASPSTRPAPPAGALPTAELRRRFLAEGAEQSRRLIETLGTGFHREEARDTFRRWSGLGKTLGTGTDRRACAPGRDAAGRAAPAGFAATIRDAQPASPAFHSAAAAQTGHGAIARADDQTARREEARIDCV